MLYPKIVPPRGLFCCFFLLFLVHGNAICGAQKTKTTIFTEMALLRATNLKQLLYWNYTLNFTGFTFRKKKLPTAKKGHGAVLVFFFFLLLLLLLLFYNGNPRPPAVYRGVTLPAKKKRQEFRSFVIDILKTEDIGKHSEACAWNVDCFFFVEIYVCEKNGQCFYFKT